jgi:hypothetical protein
MAVSQTVQASKFLCLAGSFRAVDKFGPQPHPVARAQPCGSALSVRVHPSPEADSALRHFVVKLLLETHLAL